MPKTLRTADYSAEARERLGEAVKNGRLASGHRWRTSFARAADISVRSVQAVEKGEPVVGEAALYAIGRTLPNWTPETPRAILEGEDPPPIEPRPQAAEPKVMTAVAPDVRPFDQRALMLWDAYYEWRHEHGHDEAIKMMEEQLELLRARGESRTRNDTRRPHGE